MLAYNIMCRDSWNFAPCDHASVYKKRHPGLECGMCLGSQTVQRANNVKCQHFNHERIAYSISNLKPGP